MSIIFNKKSRDFTRDFLCYNFSVIKFRHEEEKMADEGKMIATIPRSATEQLQIAIKEFKGKSYLDLRIFYTTDDGATWLPTKKGVTCSPENIELLKEAVDEAFSEFTSVEEE